MNHHPQYLMHRLCEEYVLACSVEEALLALSTSHDRARILSGGSDLLLEIQRGAHPAVNTLVDVTQIDEMCAIEVQGAFLFIGAAVTLSRLAKSPLVKEHAQVLADSATLMANPQVCNVATLGGNVAHALPAADGTISLLALDARVEIASLVGRRWVSIPDLFKGPGESTLDPCSDILVGFYVPVCEGGQASAFSRRVNPQGIALAMLNMGLWLQRKEDQIADVRIAVGPAGPVPIRMLSAEKALIGQKPSVEVRRRAMEELLGEAHFRTSPHRTTAEYRRSIAGVLLEETLSKAWQRAG